MCCLTRVPLCLCPRSARPTLVPLRTHWASSQSMPSVCTTPAAIFQTELRTMLLCFISAPRRCLFWWQSGRNCRPLFRPWQLHLATFVLCAQKSLSIKWLSSERNRADPLSHAHLNTVSTARGFGRCYISNCNTTPFHYEGGGRDYLFSTWILELSSRNVYVKCHRPTSPTKKSNWSWNVIAALLWLLHNTGFMKMVHALWDKNCQIIKTCPKWNFYSRHWVPHDGSRGQPSSSCNNGSRIDDYLVVVR